MSPLDRRYRDLATGREAAQLHELVQPGRPLDRGGVSDLLAFGYLAGRRTLLGGVERVVEPLELPEPEVLPEALPSPDQRADRLWELLLAAVSRAVEGEPRPRSTLSGGLDSRAVAAALAALAPPDCSVGTFGDPDCADLPVARRVAEALGLPHEVTLLEPDCALEHEERVWWSTGGTGGPAAAPGAATDASWARSCGVLLSGASGDVIWGSSERAGPSPLRRLRRLGVPWSPPSWDEELPPAPPWASAPGREAWKNLWTRQSGGTWNGVLPRLAYTPTVPVLWDPELLAWCLALGEEDRRERALLRLMLRRHAPSVSVTAITLAARGPVHDLDRAFASCERWRQELARWAAEPGLFESLGLKRRAVGRLVRRALSGRGARRSGFLSRLRCLSRWPGLLSDSGSSAR